MKQATAKDAWRRLNSRPPQSRLSSLMLRGANLLHGELTFSPRLTLLCGANGVGKTTILRALEFLFLESTNTRSKARLNDAQVTLTFSVEGTDRQVSAHAKDGAREGDLDVLPEAMFLDPAERAVSLVTLFADMKNVEELLEQYEERAYRPDLLEIARNISGKPYDSCSVYEIEDLEEDGVVTPYFLAKCGGVTYATPDMGRGELAVHLMLWALERIAARSVLLLEEPESHITPRAQKVFMDVLAAKCVKKGISIVATTHSSWTLASAPRDIVRLLYYHDETLHLDPAPSRERLDDALGVSRLRSGVVLVEDEVAKLHLVAVLRRLDGGLLRRNEVLVAGNDDGVAKAIDFPRSDESFKIAGVFDGDQRTGRAGASHVWPFTFFPGDAGPEGYLWPLLASDPCRVADLLGAESADAVRAAAASAAGSDLHDRFTMVRAALGCSLEHLVSTVTRIWLDTEGAAAEELVTWLREAMNSWGD